MCNRLRLTHHASCIRSMNQLTTTEQQILQIIQSDFPLDPRPYSIIGAAIGKTEDEVLETLHSLKERNVIRQISAIFHGSALGFQSTLVCFQVPEETLDSTAQIINAHPGVSHNYQRKHQFNLWFTLAVPKDLRLDLHVKKLAELTSCHTYLSLPSVHMFKRRVQLDLESQSHNVRITSQLSGDLPPVSSKITLSSKIQQKIMNVLQHDLPLTSTPFQDIATQFQVENDSFFHFLRSLADSKKMSRFAGIVKHRNLGFSANAMVVWAVPQEQVQLFVEQAISYNAISHCYERVTYPEWPYNMYTMIHGKTEEFTQNIIDELLAKFQKLHYEILYSGKEYKKQRVNFFSRDIYDWHEKHMTR